MRPFPCLVLRGHRDTPWAGATDSARSLLLDAERGVHSEMATNGFTTINRARTLRERHPDAPPSACHVALFMATYADGKSGTSIRPGFEAIEEGTGLSRRGVQMAVRWLEDHDEIRREREARRGSAALFTYIGGREQGALSASSHGQAVTKQGALSAPNTAIGAHSARDGAHSVTSHLPDQPDKTSRTAPTGEVCSKCGGRLGYKLDGGDPKLAQCLKCFHGR